MPNTSRGKGNQTMKFGQLIIVYNVTDIFLQKSYANHTEKLFPDLFLKNQDLLFYSFIV